MKLNNRQIIANARPHTSMKMKTTATGTEMVATSFLGIPSIGT